MGPISIDENELQNRIDRAVKAGLGAVGSGIYKDHPLAAAFPMPAKVVRVKEPVSATPAAQRRHGPSRSGTSGRLTK